MYVRVYVSVELLRKRYHGNAVILTIYSKQTVHESHYTIKLPQHSLTLSRGATLSGA